MMRDLRDSLGRRASKVAGHSEGWMQLLQEFPQYHRSPGAVHRRIERCVVSPPGATRLIPAVVTCHSRDRPFFCHTYQLADCFHDGK